MARDHYPTAPASPFAPIAALFLCPDSGSDLFAFLKETHALIEEAPSLLRAVEKDLDAHGLRKKAQRVADAEWLARRTANLPGMPRPTRDPDEPVVLWEGRPRTPGYVVLFAMLLRGYSGSGLDFGASGSGSLSLSGHPVYHFFESTIAGGS